MTHVINQAANQISDFGGDWICMNMRERKKKRIYEK